MKVEKGSDDLGDFVIVRFRWRTFGSTQLPRRFCQPEVFDEGGL